MAQALKEKLKLGEWRCSHISYMLTSSSPSRRGAATKARKSLHAMAPKSLTSLDSVEQMEKTIRIIKRNRKQRHGRLKEIIAQDDEENSGPVTIQNEATCPICSSVVRGDPDVIDAHVDACVINASRLQAEEEAREAARRAQEDVDAWGEFEVNGEVRLRLTNAAGLRGSGIHVRDRAQADVDDEIDVDGDDEAVFGGAQFTEQDVLEPNFVINAPDVQVNVEDDVPPANTSVDVLDNHTCSDQFFSIAYLT